MGILTDLKALRQHDEEVARKREEAEKAKVTWLSVAPGETVEIILLQELDDSSERYSEKNGTAIFAQEHQNPSKDKFFLRMLCTNDEEHDNECWGCEKNRQMYQQDPDYKGGWRTRTNLYVNVLVRRKNPETGEKEEFVAVLQRTRSKNSYVNDLIDLAIEDGFVSNRVFRLSRKGEGRDTVYSLMPRQDDAGLDVESYDLFDLNNVVREVPYADQAKAMGEAVATPAASEVRVTEDDEDDDENWL